MSENRSSFIGVGLRPPHYSFLESAEETAVQWFEALSENYMDSQGRPRAILRKVRQRFPIALHGVGLSIGSADGLNQTYMQSLKNLVDETEPFLVSDHLCWTGVEGRPVHDLLPLPYTQESIDVVCNNLDQIQSFLQQPIALENVSSYLRFKHSEMSEWEFIKEIQKRSGCYLLLDVNNVFVNSFNHQFDGKEFIDGIPLSAIRQIHLAGHSRFDDFLFDTHTGTVCDEVWELLRYTKTQMKKESSASPALLVEWDTDIPEWEVLEKEAIKAKNVWEEIT